MYLWQTNRGKKPTQDAKVNVSNRVSDSLCADGQYGGVLGVGVITHWLLRLSERRWRKLSAYAMMARLVHLRNPRSVYWFPEFHFKKQISKQSFQVWSKRGKVVTVRWGEVGSEESFFSPRVWTCMCVWKRECLCMTNTIPVWRFAHLLSTVASS